MCFPAMQGSPGSNTVILTMTLKQFQVAGRIYEDTLYVPFISYRYFMDLTISVTKETFLIISLTFLNV